MSDPVVAAKAPVKVTLEAGKRYFWCSCGQSSKQPFCDGSHRGTDFTPELVKVDATKTVFMCQCKATNRKPFCDGTHNKL